MNFDVLIPTQEQEVAQQLIDYVNDLFMLGPPMSKSIAKEMADAKYWEAYDCEDHSRQEYWRQVKMAFDDL